MAPNPSNHIWEGGIMPPNIPTHLVNTRRGIIACRRGMRKADAHISDTRITLPSSLSLPHPPGYPG
ncbi:hypothetical protein LZ31DRAFT_547927 [Colletotrichum somersetense]|nr:hypothetical protein LZ31DRAFT_547927 [Colletotrichum somersetense]